jgi:hypothetical protein
MIDHNPYPQPDASTVCSWEGYLYFVFEREAMRIAKENGYAGELTNDQVLHDYRFTNIRRKDDRMSKWIIEHIIHPGTDNEHLWFTLLITRLVNWPPTLQALIDCCVIPCVPEKFDPVRFSEVIEDCKLDGKVFGSAYMIYPTMMEPGGTKSSAVAKYIIGDAVKKANYINSHLWEHKPSVERMVTALSQCFGVSTFIVGQVVADLTYTGLDFEDLYSYAPLGPGSQEGLNLLFGLKKHHMWSQSEFNYTLMQANVKIYNELDITDLTLHDVQNTMSEFSKYAKAVLGERRPRRLYSPETAY